MLAGLVPPEAVRENVSQAPDLGLYRAISPCVSSHHLLPMSVSVSKCPPYIKTPVIEDEGTSK